MRIANFPRINRGDFQGSPEWFGRFIERLNPVLEEVIDCLQGNVYLEHNQNGVYRRVEVAQGVEYEIQTGINGRARDVWIAHSEHYDYPRLAWKRATDDRIRFKVKWDTAPSGSVGVTLGIQGEGE